MDNKIFDWLHDMMKPANNETEVLVVKNDEPVAYGRLDRTIDPHTGEHVFMVEKFEFTEEQVDRVNEEALIIYMK